MKNKKGILVVIIFFILILTGCGNGPLTAPEIKIYTRDVTSGTRDGFFSAIVFPEARQDNTALRSDYIELETNGDMINAITNDRYGIGYISLTSLLQSGLKGLYLNNVAPTTENVTSGLYKMTRNFNYVIRDEFASADEAALCEAFIA